MSFGSVIRPTLSVKSLGAVNIKLKDCVLNIKGKISEKTCEKYF